MNTKDVAEKIGEMVESIEGLESDLAEYKRNLKGYIENYFNSGKESVIRNVLLSLHITIDKIKDIKFNKNYKNLINLCKKIESAMKDNKEWAR